MKTEVEAAPQAANGNVSWENFVKFVRQLSHDLRNQLNAAELQSALIALYERAVGFYGSLVNINAYNQPGVEAGKKAATELLQLQAKVREKLNQNPQTFDQIARALGADPESVYHLLVHLNANEPTVQSADEKEVAADKFFVA